MEPSQVESWIEQGLNVITCDPAPFFVVTAGVAVIIWTIVWLIFRGEIYAKDADLATKDSAITAKDATIESLRAQLQAKSDPLVSLMLTKSE